MITAFKARAGHRPSDSDLISIEIHELDKEKPPALGELGHARHLSSPFDFERLTRFMSYGFFMAPIQFQWFGFLSRAFPLTKRNPSIPALKRVIVDQLMFAPFGMRISSEEGKRAFVADRFCRIGVLFFIHDRCRRRWEEGIDAQVPRCLSSNFEGQLRSLAGRSDPELPRCSYPVPDCESEREIFRVLLLTLSSPSCHPSVLPGLRICR